MNADDESLTRRDFITGSIAIALTAGCVNGPVFSGEKQWGRDIPGWSASSGQHYGNEEIVDSDGSGEVYSLYQTIRGPAREKSAGLSQDVTEEPIEARPDDVMELEGPFSGETRYYDFGSIERKGSMAAIVADNTTAGEDGLMLVWDEGTSERFTAEQSAYFKDAVYAAVTFFSTDSFKNSPITHWEIGNEVNGISYFNPREIEPESDESPWKYFNEIIQAKLYIDLMFGPAVEAIRRAGEDHHNDPNFFTVLNGGIAEINDPTSHDWVRNMMEMEPSATRAPSLAKTKVKEHIDILAIHYAYQPRLAYSNEGRYHGRQSMSRLYNEWVKPGVVESIWHTEEGGDGGAGAYHLALVMPRFLNWWSQRSWSPGDVRLIWWPMPGGPDSPAAELLQSKIVDHFDGSPRLLDVSEHLSIENADELEGYGFVADDSDAGTLKIALFFFNHRPGLSENHQPSTSLSSFRLEEIPDNWNTLNQNALVAETDRLRSVELTVENTNGLYRKENTALRLAYPEGEIAPFTALVILLTLE